MAKAAKKKTKKADSKSPKLKKGKKGTGKKPPMIGFGVMEPVSTGLCINRIMRNVVVDGDTSSNKIKSVAERTKGALAVIVVGVQEIAKVKQAKSALKGKPHVLLVFDKASVLDKKGIKMIDMERKPDGSGWVPMKRASINQLLTTIQAAVKGKKWEDVAEDPEHGDTYPLSVSTEFDLRKIGGKKTKLAIPESDDEQHVRKSHTDADSGAIVEWDQITDEAKALLKKATKLKKDADKRKKASKWFRKVIARRVLGKVTKEEWGAAAAKLAKAGVPMDDIKEFNKILVTCRRSTKEHLTKKTLKPKKGAPDWVVELFTKARKYGVPSSD